MLRLCLVLALLAAADAAVAQRQQTIGASASDNAATFRGQVGRRVTYVCTADINLGAQFWGTDVYTDDSPLCLSAIHAGVLQRGQAGIVTLVMGGNVSAFRSTPQNGVTSQPYTEYPSSMTFERPGGALGQTDWTTTGRGIPPGFTAPIAVTCPPGGAEAPIWGTDVYTEDSSVCTAAVHANVITFTNGGDIAVTAAPSAASFRAERRNEVTSQVYANQYRAFRVAAPGAAPAAPPASTSTGDITGIAVRVTVATATVTWTPVPDALGYVVMRWLSGDANCCNTFSSPGVLLTTNTWVDTAPLPRAGTYGFRIYAHRANGVVMGETLVVWNGVQTPTTQLLSPGASVDPVRTATRTTPAATTAGATTTVIGTSAGTLPGNGPITGTVAPAAGAPTTVIGEAGPSVAAAPIVGTLASGHYRVVLLGATVQAVTKDIPDNADGWGDEIAPAVATMLWDRRRAGETPVPIQRNFKRGLEYGGLNTSRQARNRIQAGTAPNGGGFMPGNVIPDGFVASGPHGDPQEDRFPLNVWDGTLSDGNEVLLVVPSLWERDTGAGPFEIYAASWLNMPATPTVRSVATQVPLPQIVVYESDVQPGLQVLFPLPAVVANIDHRPIGLRALPVAAPYRDRFVVITREKLAALTSIGNTMDIPIVYSEPTADPVLGGTYTLTLRIERRP